MNKEILLIHPDVDASQKIIKTLEKEDYAIIHVPNLREGLGNIYDILPALIFLYEPLIQGKAKKSFQAFKRDNVFSHIPVILLVTPDWQKKEIQWQDYPVDDYLTTSFATQELKKRVSLALNRFSRELDPNPLTRLPGNTSILKEIQRILDGGQKAAIAYVDLDNFKSFNDRYGFSRGDEALRMTARILSNIVQDYKTEGAFIGHVGGDDFVFIVPSRYIDEVCHKIIKNFDDLIVTLYEEEDRKRGYITSKDRSGKEQQFPLMSISIAAVINEERALGHYGEASQLASEVKRYVKKLPKSNYMLDRRRKKQ